MQIKLHATNLTQFYSGYNFIDSVSISMNKIRHCIEMQIMYMIIFFSNVLVIQVLKTDNKNLKNKSLMHRKMGLIHITTQKKSLFIQQIMQGLLCYCTVVDLGKKGLLKYNCQFVPAGMGVFMQVCEYTNLSECTHFCVRTWAAKSPCTFTICSEVSISFFFSFSALQRLLNYFRYPFNQCVGGYQFLVFLCSN